jgi:hypothetical protein
MLRIWMSMLIGAPLVACGGGKPSTAAVPNVAATPCPDPTLSGWQLVRGQAFVLCVPARYLVSGIESGGRARSGENEIQWGTGRPGPWTSTAKIVVPPGDTPEQVLARTLDRREWTEQIDGLSADLTSLHAPSGPYYQIALWSQPRIYVTGVATDQGTSELQLRAIRSIHFLQ